MALIEQFSTSTQPASDHHSALLDVLAPLRIDRTWVESAACAGRSEFFFDPPDETPTQRRRRETSARNICDRCPVQHECREWARQNREHGFWGAENEEERTLAGHMPRSSGRRTVLAARRRATQLS